MKENSKLAMMAVILSSDISGITSTVAVTAANNNYQRLFRNQEGCISRSTHL